MNASLFKIGDKVKRTDYYDPKIYTIEKVREWRGEWIYSMVGQTYANGWCWVAEWNIVKFKKYPGSCGSSELGHEDHNCKICANNKDGCPENCHYWQCYAGYECHFKQE